MIKTQKQLLALLSAIAAFIVVGLLLTQPSTPAHPPYVSSSAAPDGVKALYTLLQEKKLPASQWKKPWRALPGTANQTMVVIEPHNVSDQEMEEMDAWVKRGNHLLLFSSNPYYWDHVLLEYREKPSRDNSTVKADDGTQPEDMGNEQIGEPEPVRVPAPVAVTDLLRPDNDAPLSALVETRIRIKEEHGIEPLLTDELGIIAAQFAAGDGSISVFLTPEWTRNDQIAQHAHFELIWPYLQQNNGGALWFDEYHHGFQDKPGALAIYPDWLLALLLQVVIGAMLWLWYKAVRFGPAYTPRSWVTRSGDETLLAAAGWYERSRLAREALSHQKNYIRSLMRTNWGVRTDANDRQVIAAAKRHWDKEDIEQLSHLLDCWRAAEQTPRYSTKQFVFDSRKADLIIQKLSKE
ncbi:DUF4350 domain-containing protein [Paenibacillaceae bacterium]|nr:DUF4350 domain-containing protein [Paenibacillaceae bacterium]